MSPQKSDDPDFTLIRIQLENLVPHGQGRIFVVCSARPGEGKTFVAERLAAQMAGKHEKTLLIRANYRETLASPAIPGLMEWASFCLTERGFEEEAGRYLDRLLLPINSDQFVLPAGNPQMPLSRLFHSATLDLIFVPLLKRFQTIIIDTAALSEGTEALSLAPVASGLITVIRQGKTPEREAKKLLKWASLSGMKRLGTVLNEMPDS